MAITQTQTLPAPFLQDVTKSYAADIGKLTAAPLAYREICTDSCTTRSISTRCLWQSARRHWSLPTLHHWRRRSRFCTGRSTDGGTAATTLGGVPSYLTQAGAYSGPSGYEDFMSPYQQQVIDKTLEEYDVQAGKGLAGIGQLAAMSGNLGGGREGVQRAEYQSSSDRNRALLQAQMLQGGFGQAQQAAGQAYGQQMGLGQAQGALGQSQLGIGQYQQGLAGLVPQLYGQDTAAYGAMGAQQQAQAQAVKDAEREQARMKAYEPYERMGYLGTGITGMLGG